MSTTDAPVRVGPARQIQVYSRAELTLFWRYRTAVYFALFPLALAMMGLLQAGTEIAPGVDAGAYFTAGSLMLPPLFLSIMHLTNVVTSRREQFVLKRLRVSGTPATVVFGALIVSVLVVTAVISLVIGVVLLRRYDLAPADPLLVVLPIVLVTVAVSLFSIAFTRLCRNAESAQMICMVPLMLFYLLSGMAFPLASLPDRLADLARFLPGAPGVDIVTSAYFGRDFTGAGDGTRVLAGAELWAAAVPGLLVILAWLVLSAFLVRFVRWDPRGTR
ncbi:ABC transporter permease [Nocardiopsis sp. MG754419]|uniref:ABC transporter permease n=1 Tax=Nocardiopsis sp. MG754419 TaxID=2259865 RepID=UPI001BAE41AE|nr:ABC transporter permease [Nocardiopsis sp. MG754419]MBR8740240.1 ABC transporter permease [Nocardiopsis sp. MG754419]